MFELWLVFVAIALINYIFAPRLKKRGYKHQELISIVIPMRNEEVNADNIIHDILAQSYQNFELIIMNDSSTDKTNEILERYSSNPKVKVYKVPPLANGWIGKNFALHNSLNKVNGKVLIFIDADVRLDKDALEAALDQKIQQKAQVLICFPRQISRTFGETLAIPLMTWSHIGFVPFPLVNLPGKNSVTLANGQFWLVDTSAYKKVEGHSQIKGAINEDFELISLLKHEGFEVRVCLGDKLVSCRMYDSYKSARQGFAKNLLLNFKQPILGLFIFLILIVLNLLPLVLLRIDEWHLVYILILIHRIITSLTYKQNWLVNVILHPLQMITLLDISILSYRKVGHSQVEWKGRKIST